MKPTSRVLGLDPRIGYAVVDYFEPTDSYVVVTFGTMVKDKFQEPYKKDTKAFTKELLFLAVTQDKLTEIMDQYHPHLVASETAFHKGFLASYRVLVTWISTVALLMYRKYSLPLHLIYPTEMKKFVSEKGNADKDEIAFAIQSNPKISFDPKLDLDELTEHANDAIGIALTYIGIVFEKKKL